MEEPNGLDANLIFYIIIKTTHNDSNTIILVNTIAANIKFLQNIFITIHTFIYIIIMHKKKKNYTHV